MKALVERVQAKVAIKTGIAAALAWALGMGFSGLMDRPDRLVSGLWCTLSAIVVLQAHLGGTYNSAWLRFLGVLVGSILGSFCTMLLGSDPVSLGISITGTILVCSLLNLHDSIRIACLSVAVVMILWGLQSTLSPWVFAFYRTLDSCLGIAIAVLVAHAIWPTQATEKMRSNTGQIIQRFNQLYRFLCKGETAERLIVEESGRLMTEIQSLLEQNSEFLTEAKMELLTRPERLDDWISLNEHLESLFEIFLVIQKVHPLPGQMLDPLLQSELVTSVDTLDRILQELSSGLMARKPFDAPQNLKALQENLSADIARFRGTHALQKFSLGEVESFFVFFFNFNASIEEVSKISKKIKTINEK